MSKFQTLSELIDSVEAEQKPQNPKKKYELVGLVNTEINNLSIINVEDIANTGWRNAICIRKKNKGCYDIIFCWNAVPDDGILYLGYWNDGNV